jgi:hypothetical protein
MGLHHVLITPSELLKIVFSDRALACLMMYRILDEDIMKDNDSAVIKTLQEAPLRGHLVDFYDDPMRLAERVADFAEPGLREKDEAVVLIATSQHLDLFRKALRNWQLPVEELEQSGRLK